MGVRIMKTRFRENEGVIELKTTRTRGIKSRTDKCERDPRPKDEPTGRSFWEMLFGKHGDKLPDNLK